MSKAYDDACKLLPHMTHEELRLLVTQAKAIQSMPDVSNVQALTTRDAQNVDNELVGIMCEACKGLGIEIYFAVLQRAAREQANREKLQAVRKYLFTSAKTKQQRNAVFRIGIELLYEDLSWRDLPVTGVTLLQHIHRLPAVFDRHFPGYARAGMLGMVVNRQTRNGHDQATQRHGAR